MPFKSAWYVEGQVIYTRVWGAITSEELHANILDVQQHYYEQSTQLFVHQLVDNRAVSQQLSGRDMVSAMPKTPHPRAGWSLIIGQVHPVARFLSDVAMQVIRLRFRFYKTPEEAIAFLKEADNTIDWDKADNSLFNAPLPEAEKKP